MTEILIAVVGTVAALGAVFWFGRRGERDRQAAKHGKDYRDDRRKADEVLDDDRDWRDRLGSDRVRRDLDGQ